MLATIRDLGFSPQLAPDGEGVLNAQTRAPDCARTTEPIAQALKKAQAENRLLLIDFFAGWCGPCQELEEKILPTPVVQEALERFEFLRVDTDSNPEASSCLQVFGLPTLVVLQGTGDELFRQVGLLSAAELARQLNELPAGFPNKDIEPRK